MMGMLVTFVRRAGFISLLSLMLLSGYQLLSKPSMANIPACQSMECYDASDCGGHCYCNRPSGFCNNN